jgi:adenylate cyclase
MGMFMPHVRRLAPTATEARLQQFIEERVKPGADKAAIDQRIWNLFGERWAVMFTDLCGFSRNVADFGIIHFLQTIHESLRLLTPCLERHDGILLKVEADSLLVIFRHPEQALRCAQAMHATLAAYNRGVPANEQILLAVGLGYGEVLRLGDADVFGSEVNAASKLGEDTAKADEVLVTEAVRAALADVPNLAWQRLDEAPAGTTAAWRVSAR